MSSSNGNPSRLRISLLPPFPAGKYLLPIPSTLNTTSDLQRHILATVENVRGLVRHPKEICLEVDGFEVIDGPLDILREGDVVW